MKLNEIIQGDISNEKKSLFSDFNASYVKEMLLSTIINDENQINASKFTKYY